MQVEALGLSQEMNFGDGSVTNFLMLRLPSGDVVKALVSDAAVERIAANLAGAKTGVAPPPPAARPVQAPAGQVGVASQGTESEAFIFGGGPAEAAAEVPAPPPPPPPVRPKITRVEKDSMGYPIVRTAGGNSLDTDSAIGGGAIQDEDGIGQG